MRDPREWEDPLFLRADKGGRRSVGELLRMLQNGDLVVPDYQRDRVWSEAQKAAWVGHALAGGPLPSVAIREVNTDTGFRDEIVDGQQRLTAMLEWTEGRFAAVIPWSGEEARCECDLHRRSMWRIGIPVITLPVETTDAEAIAFYLRLNTAGTPHTEAELERVRGMLAEVTRA